MIPSKIFGKLNRKKRTVEEIEELAAMENLEIEAEQVVEAAGLAAEVQEEEEVVEEAFDPFVDCAGDNLFKLFDLLDKPYSTNFIFEPEDAHFEMISDKNKERALMSSWINISCGSTMANLNIATMKYNKAVETEKAKAIEEDRPEKMVPRCSMDAKSVIHVSSDGIVAWLLFLPPVGDGAHITIEKVQETIKNKKIIFGLNEEYIEFMIEKKKYFHTYPIAIGSVPIMGTDGYFVDYYPREVKKYMPDAEGTIDYKAVDDFMPIFEGDTICEIIPPNLGGDGRSVHDVKLPGKLGKAPKVPQGKNTEVSTDGTLLVSTIDGDVTFLGGKFSVRNVYTVQGDVDYSTGNINFMGDVVVNGDVRGNFIVRATGSVVVKGVLESGVIDAEGDVVIKGGVFGSEEGTIRCRGDVSAKFIESCRVYCAGSITTDYIVRSDIYCDGPIMVNTGKATIIGGSIWAHSFIETHSLGRANAPARSTVINMGADPCNGGDVTSTRNFLHAFQHEDSSVTLDDVTDIRRLLNEMEDVEDEGEIPPDPKKVDRSLFGKCSGKFATINTGVCFKYKADVMDIKFTTAGLVRFDKTANRITITS